MAYFPGAFDTSSLRYALIFGPEHNRRTVWGIKWGSDVTVQFRGGLSQTQKLNWVFSLALSPNPEPNPPNWFAVVQFEFGLSLNQFIICII